MSKKMTWDWFAGFHEGEGHVSYRTSKREFRFEISQTNFSVLKKIEKFLRAGKVHTGRKKNKKWKTLWSYDVYGVKAARICVTLLPFMQHEGKIQQIIKALRAYRKGLKRPSTIEEFDRLLKSSQK